MNSMNNQGPVTLFRIFVEDVGNRDQLKELVEEKLDSAHISYGTGIWKGSRENDAVVEHYGREADRGEITLLATMLRNAFNQKAVAVAEHNDHVTFYMV